MTDLGERFFASIDFDGDQINLDFLSFNKEGDIWHYYLLKKTPWTFSDFNDFTLALTSISYPHKIHYAYEHRPTEQDTIKLFLEYYRATEHKEPNFELTPLPNEGFSVTFKTEEDAINASGILADFALVLVEINYFFTTINKVVLREENENEEFSIASDPPFIEEDEANYDQEFAATSAKVHEGIHDELAQNMVKLQKERSKNKGERVYEVWDIKDINKSHLKKNIDIDGEIYNFEKRPHKSGVRYVMGVGKNGHGVVVHMNITKRGSSQEKTLKNLAVGKFVRVQGEITVDEYRGGSLYVSAWIIDEIAPPPLPEDHYEGTKRIELHLHTKMSALDAVSSVTDYVKLAKNMGHQALAITDHGVAQAFPEAQKAGQDYGIKIIYGSELYVIDEKLKFINNPAPILLDKARYVVFDLETTGLSSNYHDIIEFGAVKVEHGLVTSRLDFLIHPGKGKTIPLHIEKITHISNEMVAEKPYLDEVLDSIIDFLGDDILVTHNAEFDLGFINVALKKRGRNPLSNPTIDTLSLSRYLFPESRGHRLGILARNMDVLYDEDAAHRADFDAEVLNNIWQAMLSKLLVNSPYLTHADLANLELSQEGYQYLRPIHAVVLVKNTEGLRDLNKLISVSHTKYATDIPKTPRALLHSLRTNLLIGSGCFNGEVFNAAARFDEDALLKVMAFYDYIEIQPFANYEYLLHMGELDSEDQLRQVIKDIKNAAQKLGKPLVATGDVHYATKEDKLYRDVYIVAKGLKGVKHPLNPYDREKRPAFENPDQHYRSTTEMFEEFRRFNVFTEEELETMIIKNPHRINDLVAPLTPFTKELFKPSIENVDQLLTTLVYDTAYYMYGNPLPLLISSRVERELNGIIKNGFAVIYYLAHQIVKKAHDSGFIVGSRGSVGSSVVAHFAKISEVNPLPPHYYCQACQYSDFENKEKVLSGFDLPPKECPHCGHELKRDGQNIPFETFLGFSAEKIPDIDLNFPDEFQKVAHNYTKVLFGEENAVRAGTIQTVAAKTAYGYVLNYFETLGLSKDQINSETVSFYASHVAGVKRTTGQHPGGIIVIPSDYEVYDFTAVQYPAGNLESDWLTSHFDYNSMHDNLLKLDLLGHKDPVALQMLCDLTGIHIDDVPTTDKEVISLFNSIKPLNLQSNPLNEVTGALGLPEFGTQFVRQLLADSKPQTFNDLIIVSGLSHGTGVWRFNADELIKKRLATLTGVIGCRDDIMTYLIAQNMDQKDAFNIMETVRKGKDLSPELEARMKEAGVPPFYIESCKKIEYLFPRAHAAAYVIMAVKVAWFKLYYPLEYYATFFTIRGDNFDLKTMISNQNEILRVLAQFAAQRQDKELNMRDQNIIENLQLTLEMMNRGFKISNVDLYKSEATKFIVDKENNQVIPPFIVIKALGEAAALSVIEARAQSEFISIADLEERTRLNTSNIEQLKELGVLKDLPESNQMSLFDFGDY